MNQEIDYQVKYLKYKEKYLNLKLNKQIGGWNSDLIKIFKENNIDLVEKISTQNQGIYDSVSGDPDEYKTYTYSIGTETVFRITETNGIIEKDLDIEGKFIFAINILIGAVNDLEKILELLIKAFETTSLKEKYTKLKIYIPKENNNETILTKLRFTKKDDNFNSYVFNNKI